MHLIECKQCGGEVPFEEGKQVAVCPFCNSQNTLSKQLEVQGGLVNRANYLRRNNEFDKAMDIYEDLLKIDNTDYDAHWGTVLCHYGIEYVEDPATMEKIPTCHRARNESILTNLSYKTALEYAPLDVKEVYEREANQINNIQKRIIKLAEREEEYDVFICYKETDEAGSRTEDSIIAQELEFELTKRGYKVFFARKSLEGKLGSAYEPIIFAALHSAKVMVVLGTRPDNFNAVWVKNEWSRYRALINESESKTLIPAYRGMSPYDLPQEFSNLQALDMSKLGFVQDLCDGINRITRGTQKAAAASDNSAETAGSGLNTSNPSTKTLLKRAFLFIEEGDNVKADEYIERVLDINPEEALAYIAKMMIGFGICNESQFDNCVTPLEQNINFKKAIRFADPILRAKYEDYNQAIVNRMEEAKRIKEEEIERQRQKRIKEEREAQEHKKAKRRKRRRTFWSVSITLISLSILFIYIGINSQKNASYDQAVSLMEKQQYYEATEILKTLDDFKDSQDLYKEAVEKNMETQYAQGLEAMEAFDYSTATLAFARAEDYKDSDKYLNSISIIAFEAGDYGLAALAWQGGGDKYTTDSPKASEIEAMVEKIRNSVDAYNNSTIGLTLKGEILVYSSSSDNKKAADWTNITAVAIGAYHCAGLKSDGTVVTSTGGVWADDEGDVDDWTDIVAIAAGYESTAGLKSDGTVVTTGQMSEISDGFGWESIIQIALSDDSLCGLASDGTVKSYRFSVSEWRNITAISATSTHLVGLRSDGTVVAAGENKNGQCDVDDWDHIVAIATGTAPGGSDYTVGLKSDGTVVTTKEQSYYYENISEWTNIVAITAGYDIIGVKSDGTVLWAENSGRLNWNLFYD